MNKYYVDTDKDDFGIGNVADVYSVFNSETEVLVASFYTEEQAEEYCKMLNGEE